MSSIQSPEDALESCRREMYQLAEDLDVLTPHASLDPTVAKAGGVVRRKFILACERYTAALLRGEAS